MSYYKNLPDTGYTIFKGVLPDLTCERVADHFSQRTVDMVFNDRGFDVSDLPLEDALELLTIPLKRREYFGDRADESVWRNGNSRDPVHSKSCGMVHIHYDQQLLQDITLNEDLYKIATEVYGHSELVHSSGLERICIKPRESTDMPQHIDSNLFYPEVNSKVRIQSLVTLQIDTHEKTKTRDTGTICIIPHFHRYWDFAGRLLHPKLGYKDCRMENAPTGRFFVLPTGKEGWDNKYFPALRYHIKMYSDYVHRAEIPLDPEVREYYQQLAADGIAIPNDPPQVLDEMVWTPIKLEPGDMFWWHQHIPHRSLRNKTKVPRIVAYYSVFPVEKGWYRSEEQRWLATQVSKLEFYYAKTGAVTEYPCRSTNIEEMAYLLSYPDVAKKVRSMITSTPLTRRLCGLESWYGETNGTVYDEETGQTYKLGPDGYVQIEFNM